MRVIAMLIVAALLTGCGADGEPIRPTYGVGATISSDGVEGRARVSVARGPFTISVGK